MRKCDATIIDYLFKEFEKPMEQVTLQRQDTLVFKNNEVHMSYNLNEGFIGVKDLQTNKSYSVTICKLYSPKLDNINLEEKLKKHIKSKVEWLANNAFDDNVETKFKEFEQFKEITPSVEQKVKDFEIALTYRLKKYPKYYVEMIDKLLKDKYNCRLDFEYVQLFLISKEFDRCYMPIGLKLSVMNNFAEILETVNKKIREASKGCWDEDFYAKKGTQNET